MPYKHKAPWTPSITLCAIPDYIEGRGLHFTIELDSIDSKEEFLEEIHAKMKAVSEEQKDSVLREEWIVIDSEEVPSCYVKEYDLDSDFFEFREAVMKDDDSQETYKKFCTGVALGIDVEKIEEAFIGTYAEDKEYAEEYYNSCHDMDALPSWVRNHIDWEGVARAELGGEFISQDTYYFRQNW